VTGTTKRFAWDRSGGLLMALSDGDRTYIYGPGGMPIQQVDAAGTATWFHHDQLGSTRLLTDTAGAAVGAFTYDAYGNLTGRSGTATTPLGFAGEYTDAGTGLVYLRARYYDPATGQFISRDPLEAVTGEAYGYVSGNPLNATDPTGLCPFCLVVFWGAASGAAGDILLQVALDVADGCFEGFGAISWTSVVVSAIFGGLSQGLLKGPAAIGRARSVAGVADDLGGLCRTNSFVPATLVLMADGSTKCIADVRFGDMVMAADPETGERGPRRVTNTITGDGIKELVDIEVDGHVITATDRHPFWVDDEGRWVDAEDLEAGAALLLADGEAVTVDAVRERTEERRVHNLSVDGIRNQFGNYLG
jgi:RHS repeat-associated protein